MKPTRSENFVRERLLGSGSDHYCPPIWRAVTDSADLSASNGRVIRYLLSDSSVARDGHTVATRGWDLQSYLTNPVVLWAHASDDLPIGRMVEIGAVGDRLMGSVEYPEADVYPFADTVYRLVKGGYLNAVSVSWLPLEWKFSTDRSRPGGIDFLRQEMLETSQVPVPALPSALASARAAGIDTGPLYEWAEKVLDSGESVIVPRTEMEKLRKAAKMPTAHTRASEEREAPADTYERADGADWKVGAARDLPVEESGSWDGAAAKASIFEHAGGDDFDPAKARKGFLVYDAAAPKERGSYKLPFAHASGGELKAVASGIRAAASRLPQTDIPDSAKSSARSVIDHYESKMKSGSADEKRSPIAVLVAEFEIVRRNAPSAKQRGLGMVAWLFNVLDALYDFVNAIKTEAAYEGDQSPVPAALLAIANDLAAAAMTYATEEIAEEAEGEDVEIGYLPYMMASPEGERRASLIGRLRALDRAPPETQDPLVLRIGPDVAQSVVEALERHMRAGRVLSADNETKFRSAYDMIGSAHSMIGSVLAMVAAPEPQEVDDGQRSVTPPPIPELRTPLPALSNVDEERAAAQDFLATLTPAKAA